MKRISLLFIFLILLSGLGTAGDFPKQSNKKRKVPIKSTTGVPVFRSPIYSPVQVFIYGNVLMVNFQEALKNVLVKIENIETNEIILLKCKHPIKYTLYFHKIENSISTLVKS